MGYRHSGRGWISRGAARRLDQEIRSIFRVRTPDFEMKADRKAAPQDDLALGAEGARRHADRKRRETEVERAASIERPRRQDPLDF